MARIKELKLVRVGNSQMITVPKEYQEIQSRHCRKEGTVLIAFLFPEEIAEYETKCQTLTR